MTRQQAMKYLPELFHRMSALGAGGETLTAVSIFIDWLYKNGFEIRSLKERRRENRGREAS